ncbi:class I SAM-dependent methyltransferase [Micromonospora zingiberis]|uniref:Class I SAM-dependent methyltransferase n=1 Tax=Micromonospora zingiberis TaxID=2053011 RepID=A0A4R0GRV1_9ACTN|nr:class I SAM-dependent methyltransferase [Micromonospora zingiberis]TCC00351.1 class I SAM-dependent methyltransferase [Micromonospora zingiberis]
MTEHQVVEIEHQVAEGAPVELPPDFAQWLALREPADVAARAVDLVEAVRATLTGDGPYVLHDLGAGTGSLGRWLAPLLPGPQHWILYDQDPDLLARARADMPTAAADGAPVTVHTRQGDLTRLRAADLAGAALVTASALLDMLTAAEIDHLVAVCAEAGCPALFLISVTGTVRLTPADPLDGEIADAFNAHQRRTAGGRRLLGPDAVDACATAFARHAMTVRTRPSPWRLGPEQADLTAQWLTGWLDAACEQRPELTDLTREYAQRRLAEAKAGRLRVLVDHTDLLAVPH